MRCPECQKRNSVAAWKCKFCGAKFKRKTMSMGKRAVLFAAGLLLGGGIYLAFALPKMVDPAEQLMSTAKKVASGPTSPEDAKKSKADFDEAVRKLLVKYGDSSLTALSARLKGCLPPNGPFEVMVVELPKALKLVEVDTVLQATDFLVMKGTNDTRVIPLQGFEVYDDARIVNDQTGSVIVLLGHSSGQLPHRPIVKTYALLPDNVEDDTSSMVPSILGDGTAKFGKDSTDIFVELSLPSIALAERITINTQLPPERLAKIKLQWKDAKYIPTMDFPSDLPSAMVLLARSLKYPEFAGSVTAAFGAEAGKLMKEHSSNDFQDMVITKNPDKKKTSSYTIASGTKRIDLELKKAGNYWQVDSYKVSVQAAPIAVATSTSTSTSTPANTGADTTASSSSTSSQSTSSSGSVSTVASSSSESKSATVVSTPDPNAKPAENKSNADPRQKSGQEILAGLSPAKAGANAADPGKNGKAASSSWLDDPAEKTPVAVLPSNSKNDKKAAEEKAAREKAEKEKQEREKADKKQKEKAEREKAEKEKADREKADREKAEREKAQQEKVESVSVSSAKISDTLGTESVRMRSGPGLGMKTLDEIPKGRQIQILGKTQGWYKVSYGGKVGYVYAPLVDTSGKSSAAPPSEPKVTRNTTAPNTAVPADSGGSGSVVVRPMNVRDENRRVLTTVQPGQRVQVIGGLVNNRYKIRLQDGTVGYVNKEAIRNAKVESPPEFVP